MDNTVALAALTLAGTIAAGFFAMVGAQNKIHAKLSDSIDKMTKSNEKIATETKNVADATEKASDEARDRNGHLAELVVQQGERIMSGTTVKQQNVEHLHVENETVEKKA